MPPIEYDPSRSALYSPGLRPTLFVAGADPTPTQLGIECARLAYLKADGEADAGDEPRRLIDAMALVGFDTPLRFAGEHGTQGFCCYRARDKLAILAFRGTQPEELADLATDLRASVEPWPESDGNVHRGFAMALRGVEDPIVRWHAGLPVDRSLLICGHSLGAALATLAASIWNPAHLVTIGSPRVGDPAFAKTIEHIDVTRIVDCCDAITMLPPETPWYTHFGPPTFIQADGSVEVDPDQGHVSADQMKARARYLLDHAWKKGAVLIRDLADHAPINYARAFFR